MSTFEVKIRQIKSVIKHPNADTLDIIQIDDYNCIVRSGSFELNSLIVYIPESSIVPDWLIAKLGLTGKLAGPNHNRVKAIRLRGVLSQGLIYPVRTENGLTYIEADIPGNNFSAVEGQDVTLLLGITKYEPPIPIHMSGEVWNASDFTIKYDIENIKKFPHVFDENELVLVTEKLHGTWCCFGYHPNSEVPIVASKGLSGQGLAFKFNEANEGNLYVKMFTEVGAELLTKLRAHLAPGLAVYILGEIYGKGVQDLAYGTSKPAFRAFDIFIIQDGQGRYLTGNEFLAACRESGIETVPVLGTGAHTRAQVDALTNGKDTIAGTNIREGVVIRPLIADRRHDDIGRVILKSVSDAYLLRKGDNATEYN